MYNLPEKRRDIARSPEISARYTAVSQCLAISLCLGDISHVSQCSLLSRTQQPASTTNAQNKSSVIVGYGGCGGSKHNNNSTAGGGSSAATDSQKRAHSCGVVIVGCRGGGDGGSKHNSSAAAVGRKSSFSPWLHPN